MDGLETVRREVREAEAAVREASRAIARLVDHLTQLGIQEARLRGERNWALKQLEKEVPCERAR